jgi:hypothetical protein
MRATTNQIVINEAGYADNPFYLDLDNGIQQFDVTATTTANAALWLCDNDSPNWGIWMYHMVNGVADPRDTEGTEAVLSGVNSDLSLGSSGGCTVDANLDIFVSQDRTNNSSAFSTMEFANWNGGVLPPEAGGFSYTTGTAPGQVRWGVGTGDNTFCGVQDTVINSRTQPAMVALPMIAGPANSAAGIRVLSTSNGSAVSVTNGANIQILTNLDSGNSYTCAAWDAVGNLYGASTTRYLWRVWSPPGANQSTTVAAAQVIVPVTFAITGITATPTAAGCSTVTINFTAPGNPAPSTFRLAGAATVNGGYTPVTGAAITGGSGTYQATTISCSSEYYQIEQPAQ